MVILNISAVREGINKSFRENKSETDPEKLEEVWRIITNMIIYLEI